MTHVAIGAVARSMPRGGTVLPLFAVLLFVFLPLCALVIDLGLAQLTRRQMQAGVNMAAVEGLRHLKTEPVERKTEPVERMNAVLRELYRHGTGPVIDVSGGRILPGTDFEAGGVASIGSWTTSLQPNDGDAPHGDVVAGEYVGGVPDEDDYYARSDFEPGSGNNALLVRLRRTNAPGPLDDQPGVSSHGPGLPYLFFRGPYGAFQPVDPRQQGLTIRATAIAAAQPALSVGVPVTENTDYLGVAPCWISVTSWLAMAASSDRDAERPDPLAAVTVTVTGNEFKMGVDGNFTTLSNTTIGMSLAAGSPVAIDGCHFVPLYATLSSGTRRVVGFGIARFDFPSPDGTETAGAITKLQSRVALSNASSVLLTPLTSLPPGEIDEVFQEWRSLVPNNADPDEISSLGLVFVPALRRTVP